MITDLRGVYENSLGRFFGKEVCVLFKSGEKPKLDEMRWRASTVYDLQNLAYDDNYVGEVCHVLNAERKTDGTGYDCFFDLSNTPITNTRGWHLLKSLQGLPHGYGMVPKITNDRLFQAGGFNHFPARSKALDFSQTYNDIGLQVKGRRLGAPANIEEIYTDFVAESDFEGIILSTIQDVDNLSDSLTITDLDANDDEIGLSSGKRLFHGEQEAAVYRSGSRVFKKGKRYRLRWKIRNYTTSNHFIRRKHFGLYTENKEQVDAFNESEKEITHAIIMSRQYAGRLNLWRDSTPLLLADITDINSKTLSDILLLRKKVRYGEDIEILDSKFTWGTIS